MLLIKQDGRVCLIHKLFSVAKKALETAREGVLPTQSGFQDFDCLNRTVTWIRAYLRMVTTILCVPD